jgi:hypothetical protein
VSFAFDPLQGLVILQTELWRLAGSGVLLLALDFDATLKIVTRGRLMRFDSAWFNLADYQQS